MADSDPQRWVPVVHAATLGVVAASLVFGEVVLQLTGHAVPASIDSGLLILVGVVAGMFSVRANGNGTASRNGGGVAGNPGADSPGVISR
jgi:hypothetical protein